MYKTDNLIMTLGSDFQYSNAHTWFKNLDKLIFYVNERQANGSKINIFYSTPSCYLYSLYKSNQTWPVKTDDFFPYASRPNTFWTGYFTSRPALKYFVRKTNNLLHISRLMYLVGNILFPLDVDKSIVKKHFDALDRAMGEVQHHDAVSGTERQFVANNYAEKLSYGSNQVLKVLNEFSDPGYYCYNLNISECYPTEILDWMVLVIVNPLGYHKDVWVRLPVNRTDYIISDFNENQVYYEIVPIYNETLSIAGRNSIAKNELIFKASSLPPVGYNFYVIKIADPSINTNIVKAEKLNSQSNIILENAYLAARFDQNGNLIQVDNIDSMISTKISQTFCYYKSMVGNNTDSKFQASGAYAFRPNGEPICKNVESFSVTKSIQFFEIHQIYSEWISQTIRLYNDSKSLSFEWLIGSIDVSDSVGKEVIIRFTTDILSNSTFYTDSNGRETLKRVRNYRPSWPFNQTESVSGNYYPVNSRIFIRDETENANQARQLTLVTDRSQGGSSLADGSVEVMLHRRILHDDGFGVHEPLNEPGFDGNGLVVNGKINLIFNLTKNSARMHRPFAHEVNTQPLFFFTNPGKLESKKFKNDYLTFLNGSLPENLHLLTLMTDFSVDNAFIIRLEHFYELNEDSILSQPVTINFFHLFNSNAITVIGIEELSLGANMNEKELGERLIFNKSNHSSKSKKITTSTFEINPMEIRTFRLWYIINNS